MKKILLHNLSIRHLAPVSGLFDFDQNAVFFAEENDIVVTRSLLPSAYLRFLAEVGLMRHNIAFEHASILPETPGAIFEDVALFERVRTRIGDFTGEWTLDTYALTELEAKWAKRLNIAFIGDPQHFYEFGGKSAFRKVARHLNLSIPFGFESTERILESAIASARIFLLGFAEVIVKQDEGVAGLGSRRFSRGRFLESLFHLHDLFPIMVPWGVSPMASNQYVIEGWYANVIFSPSVQGYIGLNGEVSILSLHCQLFKKNQMTYRGCLSRHWIPAEIIPQLENGGLAVGNFISKRGYRGHYGLNAILLEDGRLLWVELNPRRVASSYPAQIARRIKETSGQESCYVSARVRKRHWLGKSVDFILEELFPYLYSPKSGVGIIPFDFGRLRSQGEIYLMALAESKERASSLFSYVSAI